MFGISGVSTLKTLSLCIAMVAMLSIAAFSHPETLNTDKKTDALILGVTPSTIEVLNQIPG